MNEVAPEVTHQAKPKKKFSFGRLATIAIVLVLVGGLAVTGYLYYQAKQQLHLLTTEAGQKEMAQRERTAVEGRLKKLTILPEEEPVIATIIDPDYLASQSAFYNKSIKGDKLVVYPQAQKAYIYSPERNLIVNSGPLIVEPQQGLEQNKQSPAALERVTVEIRNGSERAGAGTLLSQELNKEQFQVLQVTDAANKAYSETLLVDNGSGIAKDQLAGFAAEIDARVVSALPADEAVSTADLVVIVGAN